MHHFTTVGEMLLYYGEYRFVLVALQTQPPAALMPLITFINRQTDRKRGTNYTDFRNAKMKGKNERKEKCGTQAAVD